MFKFLGIGKKRVVAFAAALMIVATAFLTITTAPEIVLFRERLALSLFEFESKVELQPIDLATHDGLLLRSWYHPPAAGKPVIVYFPGRGGDVVRKPWQLFDLAEQGYGLVLAGYRGYGGNPGRPNEVKLYRDATGLLAKLAENQLAPDGIVLYGYSMGTGIASYMATKMKPVGVVLEAPFTSFRDVVGLTSRSMPLWLVRTQFDTRSRFAAIDSPILLLAGEQDTVTPPVFAQLLASLNERLSLLRVFPDAAHDDMFEHGAWDAVSIFLDGLQKVTMPTALAAQPGNPEE